MLPVTIVHLGVVVLGDVDVARPARAGRRPRDRRRAGVVAAAALPARAGARRSLTALACAEDRAATGGCRCRSGWTGRVISDLVGSASAIGGIASGFEATINHSVHDGHDEVSGRSPSAAERASTASSGARASRQRRFALERLFVAVSSAAQRTTAKPNKVTATAARLADGARALTATASTRAGAETLRRSTRHVNGDPDQNDGQLPMG